MDGENMTIQMAGVGNVQDMKFTLFNHLYMSAAELEQELAEGDLPEGADKEPMPPEKENPMKINRIENVFIRATVLYMKKHPVTLYKGSMIGFQRLTILKCGDFWTMTIFL